MTHEKMGTGSVDRNGERTQPGSLGALEPEAEREGKLEKQWPKHL